MENERVWEPIIGITKALGLTLSTMAPPRPSYVKGMNGTGHPLQRAVIVGDDLVIFSELDWEL